MHGRAGVRVWSSGLYFEETIGAEECFRKITLAVVLRNDSRVQCPPGETNQQATVIAWVRVDEGGIGGGKTQSDTR